MTQKEAVMQYIKDYGTITPFQAFEDLGITKLATIVSLLRREDGIEFNIETVGTKNRYGNHVNYARYSFKEN